jgi:hypothetical protein
MKMTRPPTRAALHLRYLNSGSFAALAFKGVHVHVPPNVIRLYADKLGWFAAAWALGRPVGVRGRAIMICHRG